MRGGKDLGDVRVYEGLVRECGRGRGTFRHGSRIGEVSRATSAARRPWTVMDPMGSEMLFGTV